MREAFLLRSRIGRLHFFLGGIVLKLLLFAAVIAVMTAAPGHSGTKPFTPAFFVAAALVLVAIWFGLALYVCRIRDIGWRLRPLVAVWIVYRTVDAVVAYEIPQWGANHLFQTSVGSVIGWALWLILLLMPGSGDDIDKAAPRPPRLEPHAYGAAPVA